MPVSDSSGSLPARTSDGPSGSLEHSPLLDAGGGGHTLTLFPEAGEASITRRTGPRRRPLDLTPDELAKRAEWARRAHAKRAQAKVRRFTRANRCRFMWTLTHAGDVRDLEASCADFDAFLRRLREEVGRIPLVAVPEPQPGGHAWHWHLGTDRFISVEKIRRLWGEGHVWVGDGKTGNGRMPARKLARYLAKYMGKTLAEEELPEGFTGRRVGQHRYRLTEGFAPSVVRLVFASASAAYACLKMLYGDEDGYAHFAIAGDGDPDSWWFTFPDKSLHPPPLAQPA